MSYGNVGMTLLIVRSGLDPLEQSELSNPDRTGLGGRYQAEASYVSFSGHPGTG